MNEKRLCLLVVEDDEDSLTIMTRLLERHGYDVRPARTFREAEILAATGGCDLLISDVGLPQKSGLELIRKLKLDYGLKGIAISGYVYPRDVQAAIDAGFQRFIAKPIAMEKLLKAIIELTSEVVRQIARPLLVVSAE